MNNNNNKKERSEESYIGVKVLYLTEIMLVYV